jgi:4-alpha-glucanotransferase
MALMNPLHAPLPIHPQQPSPYYASSRRYRNPLYLRIEEIPGAAEAGIELEPLARAGRALNEERRIDRDTVFTLKMTALDLLWRRFPGDPAFERFRREAGRSLEDFATFCALAEVHRSGWYSWPEEYRHPRSGAVTRFAVEHADRVAFHAWIQWLLDEQLARAGAEIPLVQDLAIGVDPNGADGWAWQDVLARGVSVGAPPDEFNTQGQDWGLPPFIPGRLRAEAYRPFVETLRASLRHTGGLRIDHVMGLFRLFWIPIGLGPKHGTYVRYPSDDLLAIVALESQRANAYIVGEDLGTVEDTVREQLAAHRMLSYRLLWFEPGPPRTYPRLALSAVTTHDLPTVAGLWNGSDLAAQREIGLRPNEVGTRELRERIQKLAGVAPDAPVEEVIVRTYARLAEAPSAVLTATLDDALAVSERPNMPGTVTEWPNWSIALPLPLEDLETAALPRRIAAELSHRRSSAEAVEGKKTTE